jgi:hypothetical protein
MMGEYIWHTMINHHHDGSNTYLYLCYACETFDSWNGTIFTAASIIHMSGTTQRYNQNAQTIYPQNNELKHINELIPKLFQQLYYWSSTSYLVF